MSHCAIRKCIRREWLKNYLNGTDGWLGLDKGNAEVMEGIGGVGTQGRLGVCEHHKDGMQVGDMEP
mgnify:CR=1 FL=1